MNIKFQFTFTFTNYTCFVTFNFNTAGFILKINPAALEVVKIMPNDTNKRQDSNQNSESDRNN